MHEIEQRVLAAIDIDGMLAYLSELVAIPSLTGQETEAQEHVATQMKKCGLEVDRWELDFDALSQHSAFSVEVDREHGLGVVGVMGQEAGGRSLIFNGHVDVVPPGDAGHRYRGASLRPGGSGYEGRTLLRSFCGQSDL